MFVSGIFFFSSNAYYPFKDKINSWSQFNFVVCKTFNFGIDWSLDIKKINMQQKVSIDFSVRHDSADSLSTSKLVCIMMASIMNSKRRDL